MKKRKTDSGVDYVSDNLSDTEAFHKIAEENTEYSLDQVSDKFFEITGRSLTRTQVSLMWNTILGIKNAAKYAADQQNQESDDSSVESIDSIENIEEEFDSFNKKEKVMTEIAESVVEPVASVEKTVKMSDTLRNIFSKDMNLSIAQVKQKCKEITGKEPSNPLIFQIKAKMKQGKQIKNKVKKVLAAKTKVEHKPSSNIKELTETLKKVKNLIAEFNGKENLIEFLTAL